MPTIDDLRTALNHAHAPAHVDSTAIIARARRRRTRHRTLAAAAAVAVAATATAVTALVPTSGTTTSPTAAAVAGDDRFLYQRWIGTHRQEGNKKLCGEIDEKWTAFDDKRPGRWLRVEGVALPEQGWTGHAQSLPTQPGCKRKITEASTVMQGNVGMPNMPEDKGHWSQPNPTFVAALPATAEALLQHAVNDGVDSYAKDRHIDPADRKAMADPTSNARHVYAFNSLISMLNSEYPHLTPQARVTTLQAIKLIPGVRNLGPTKDLLGRTGVALAEPAHKGTSAAETVTYILDPKTAEPLGTTHDQGTVAITRAVVNGATERPTT